MKFDWDESLPIDTTTSWINFRQQLPSINQLKIFCYSSQTNSSQQIHGFCDASEKAYGAVVYLRSQNKKSIKISFLCAKSKIAPLTKITIPKLELCAALLLSELLAKIRNSLELSELDVYC